MKYRLGLDFGVSSIGSAVILLNEENKAKEIVDAGVRIFPLSEGAEKRRMQKQARKNNERTKKRLQLLAHKLYGRGLWGSDSPIVDNEKKHLFPYNISPYAIRAHCLNAKLNSPYEFGRAILHIAKHRGAGFVDAMESISFSEEVELEELPSKKTKIRKSSSYDLLLRHLQDSGAETIGEYFHFRLRKSYKSRNLTLKPDYLTKSDKKRRFIRQKKDQVGDGNAVDYAIPRYLVKEEFHKIWDKQAQYYPVLQDNIYKEEIENILFYERPSAPYATADCIYIDSEKRLLKAHPLSEKRRLYESVNNIRIISNTKKRKLTREERDSILEEILMKGENANKTSVAKLLGIKRTEILFSDGETGIKSYLYSRKEFRNIPVFQNISEEKLTALAEFMAEPINPKDKLGRLYSEKDIIIELKERLGIEDEIDIGKILAKLPKGRSMLGLSATQKIISCLEENIISHREATDTFVKNGEEYFQAEELLAKKKQGQYKLLPYYGKVLPKDTQPMHDWIKQRSRTLNPDEEVYGKVANPAVHMMLNQLRIVVNDIIRIYGRPYEINLELGREVGMSSKKKDQYEKQQRVNQKKKEEAVEYLLEHKIKINNENIIKYKLAKEQGFSDAFNPKLRIHPRFVGCEIEHLIPQSCGGTDVYNNLVLVDRNENAAKGNLFPYEFFQQHKSEERIRDILKNIRTNTNLSEGKKWRFEPDARERFESQGDNEESTRYLTDTRYMAKLAARYLRVILDSRKEDNISVMSNRILTINGIHTAKLRTAWGVDGVEYELMGLEIPRYLDAEPHWINEETGEIIYSINKPDIDGHWKFKDQKRNLDWKKKSRIDYRHHALDAITIGCINRNFIQEMNWAEKRGFTINSKVYPLPLVTMDRESIKAERSKFRQDILKLLKNIKVSHKPDHSKNGQLHKEKGKSVLVLDQKLKDKTITRDKSRKIMDVVKKTSDLSKLLIPPSIKSEWHPDIALDRGKLERLVEGFQLYYSKAESNLAHHNEQLNAEGKKPKPLSEAMILSETFKIIQQLGLWKGHKFPTYKNEKSLIIIAKHGMAYTSGNNHRVDFFETNGKVDWQVINNFNANDNTFIPEAQKNGAKPIWSVHQGDLIELDTPEQWQHFTQTERCIARIKKFSDRINISFHSDARMDSPPKNSPNYMKINDLGLGFGQYSKKNARKIELTPFGKIKKKHKKLWHGTKEKT